MPFGRILPQHATGSEVDRRRRLAALALGSSGSMRRLKPLGFIARLGSARLGTFLFEGPPQYQARGRGASARGFLRHSRVLSTLRSWQQAAGRRGRFGRMIAGVGGGLIASVTMTKGSEGVPILIPSEPRAAGRGPMAPNELRGRAGAACGGRGLFNHLIRPNPRKVGPFFVSLRCARRRGLGPDLAGELPT